MRSSIRRFLVVAAVLSVCGAVAVGLWFRPRGWEDAAAPPPELDAAMRAFAAGDTEGGLRSVDRALARWRAPSWDEAARVLAAHRAASAGHPERISRYLRRALSPERPLAPFADLLRSRGFLQAKEFAAAAEASALADAAPGFPFRDDAARIRAVALEREGRGTEALATLDAAGHSLAIEAGHLAARLGDREGARRRLAAATLDGDVAASAERAMNALFELETDAARRFAGEERRRLTATARRWKDAGRAGSALELLRGGRRPDAPRSALAPDEALAEAEVLLRLGRIAEVRPLLARAASGDIGTRHGAAYLAARLRLAEADGAAYRRGLETLAKAGEWSTWRGQAMLDLARIAEGRPHAASLRAYRRYRLAAGIAADPLALWREAWIAFELGDAREAEAAFARVLARQGVPDGIREAAAYWQARRLETRGRSDEARAALRALATTSPFQYYGGLAARRLGLPPERAPESGPPDAPAAEAGAGRRWLEAARALRRVGLAELAGASYRAAIDTAPERAKKAIVLEAAARAEAGGAPAEAAEILRGAYGEMRRLGERELPVRLLRLLVPAPSGDRIAAAARRAGLDPMLVASVAAEESAFNPLAVSRAGARGLLQVMPATGAEVARRIGLAGYTPDALFDPETNLALGCAQLKSLVDRLGSVPAALAAYNAGATRAARWSLPGDGADGERFVERIPIPETRIYVKRILGNLRRFAVAWPSGLES